MTMKKTLLEQLETRFSDLIWERTPSPEGDIYVASLDKKGFTFRLTGVSDPYYHPPKMKPFDGLWEKVGAMNTELHETCR